jgi:hypothetical protein
MVIDWFTNTIKKVEGLKPEDSAALPSGIMIHTPEGIQRPGSESGWATKAAVLQGGEEVEGEGERRVRIWRDLLFTTYIFNKAILILTFNPHKSIHQLHFLLFAQQTHQPSP